MWRRPAPWYVNTRPWKARGLKNQSGPPSDGVAAANSPLGFVFRGDQRHAYRNIGQGPAVAYSVVMLAPGPG